MCSWLTTALEQSITVSITLLISLLMLFIDFYLGYNKRKDNGFLLITKKPPRRAAYVKELPICLT
jgi:hypothetical protein